MRQFGYAARFCTFLALGLGLARDANAQACAGPNDDVVTVIVDMDSARPGCQHRVRVSPGTTLVPGIAIYVLDPHESRSIWAMGYIGAIDRGLAFGHTPSNLHQGVVSALSATPGTPVNPANVPWVIPDTILDRGFAGPEVQYLELGSSSPSVIAADPVGPIFTVDVHLDGAQEGDVFAFHLLDFISVWSQGSSGVFSTRSELSLDTGGDVVADATVALMGIDPDTAVEVPPAAFLVDFVDGGITGGPAVIEVVSGIPNATESWGSVKSRYKD